jgi:hypothetical protein
MSALQLDQFYGSEKFTRWTSISKSVLTDGALYVAETAGAFWLFDSIQSYLDQHQADWAQTTMVVHDDDSATLTMTNGNDDPLSEWKIPFTDFPEPEIKIWSVRNELNAHTHMLPSEY